jgi:hypothetical protein
LSKSSFGSSCWAVLSNWVRATPNWSLPLPRTIPSSCSEMAATRLVDLSPRVVRSVSLTVTFGVGAFRLGARGSVGRA